MPIRREPYAGGNPWATEMRIIETVGLVHMINIVEGLAGWSANDELTNMVREVFK